MGPAADIIEKMGGWPDSELVFVIDSQITVKEDDLGMTVYTLPELDDLVALIQDIDVEADTQADDLM